MSVLLGYVVDIVVGAVFEMDIDNVMKARVIRALNKVVWIQNDLFARHYLPKTGAGQHEGKTVTPPPEGSEVKSGGGCPFSG